MNDILVSIIVPIYNKEKTIEKCIKTLLNQSYYCIEIILVNDGSTDRSLDLCKKFAKLDNRIILIDKPNEGVSVARNIGLDISKGDYISFVDPDDWVDSEYISLLLRTATLNKSDIVICDANIVLGEENVKKNAFFSSEGEIDRERCISQLIYNNGYYNDKPEYISIGVPWAKLYKSSLIKENNIRFKKELRRNQDNIFNLYTHQFANRIYYFNQYLYYYDYDNINHFSRKITEDATVLYSALAKETYVFYKKYYEHNELIWYLVKNKIVKYLTYIITKKVCHYSYKGNINKRIKELKDVVNQSPFIEVLKLSDRKEFDGTNKLIFILLKSKSYYLILYIFLSRSFILNKLARIE